MTRPKRYDVVVVGAGNAALTAALAAHEEGASVLVLEKAPVSLRGGNTYFTGGAIRFAYDGIEDMKRLMPELSPEEVRSMDVGSYPESAFYSDLMRVTEGMSDPELAQVLVGESKPAMMWLREQGMRFVPLWGRQAFKVGNVYRFWGGLTVEAVGGGKGLSDQLFSMLERRGIEVRYETKATRLLMDQRGWVTGATVRGPRGFHDIASRSVVLASGGFEANAEMRARYLGPGWEMAKVRGTQFNTGDGIRMALDIGAQPYGNWSGCHAVAWDMNAPPYGDRQITDLFQKHSYPFGIIVNLKGERFVDEGADFRNYTYAKYGREILYQPQRLAFQLFDAKVTQLWRDEYRIPQVTKAVANTIEELAEKLDIHKEGLVATVRAFNAAVQPGEFDPTKLDGKHTVGVQPPKSNWALPLDTPPFHGFGVTCGITFTFGGLRIDKRAQVLDTEENLIPGLYAAGELVGGLFYSNYPGGSGLCAGAVLGRIAGTSAAQDARRIPQPLEAPA
ncbi:MAG: FAD-dependent tricarballylate dehydrogenase TcuA [Chloroflexi bacterium]|nr:FAD-dependent tricarballylate dehydrogenase TcuA [Chloroflexota bacterium]